MFIWLIVTSMAIVGFRVTTDDGKLLNFIRKWGEGLIKHGLPSVQKELNEIDRKFNKERVKIARKFSEYLIDKKQYDTIIAKLAVNQNIETEALVKKQDRQSKILSYVLKPTLLCPSCMASFWGIISFLIGKFYSHVLTDWLLIVPFVFSLVFLNAIFNKWYEAE